MCAQPIPVGDIREDHYRLLQLLSDSASQTSFSNRPVWTGNYNEKLREIGQHGSSWWARPLSHQHTSFLNYFTAGSFDAVLKNTFNSDLPYGENNGAAWYGRGYTTEIQAGGWITSKYATVTFRPHLSFQQNKDFTTPRFIPNDSEVDPQYRAIFGGIDMPFRFGPDAYTTFAPGHSSIRLHYKQIETGFSTEPLWWGPGVRYALMMSNNAPGVRHLFWGTRSPITLPLNIGDVEFRLVGGWPEDSEYFDDPGAAGRKRFMSGANLIFSPSILPGFHFGFIRISHQFVPEDGLAVSDFISSIRIGDRQTTGNDTKNQLVSVYFRWLFPESSAEIYAEYFREDSYFDLRDLFLEADHDRAYTVGAQKIIYSGSGWIDFFKVNAEINNLVPGRVDEVRPQTFYYSHSRVRQGHTNRGQVLGAAIGPGSGSQYLGVEGYFEKGMLGLFIQRVEDNDFFHFEFYDRPGSGTGFKDPFRHRIDLNIGLQSHYKRGPLLLSGKVVWNKNFNYGRFGLGNLDVDFDTVEKPDVVNIQLQLTARYLF